MGDRATSGGEDETASIRGLFRGSRPNEQLNFHIQPGLPPKLKAELVDLIEMYGGKITKKLADVRGPFYALIDPNSPQAAEYVVRVTSRAELERGTPVPHSFVRSSITAREILRPIDFQSEDVTSHEESSTPAWAPLAFTRGLRRNGSTRDGDEVQDDGWGGLEPLAVHLHTSVGQDTRQSLAVKIAKAGGDPGSTLREAQVIVASEDHADFARLQKRYEHSTSVYVEPESWVERCLAKGRCFHDPVEKAPMGGRKPGAERNDFTAEDDTCLAQFIAKRIPDKSEGGRTGNNLYKDLCDRTDVYPWAAGHTWQSWRNRYRKKQDYFDPIIDGFVVTRQHSGDGKGEFLYSRGKKRAATEESSRLSSPASSSRAPTEDTTTAPRKKKRSSTKEVAPNHSRAALEKGRSHQNASASSADVRPRQPQRRQDLGGSIRSTREGSDRPPPPSVSNVEGAQRRAARPTPRGTAVSSTTADEVINSRPHQARGSSAQPTSTVSNSESNTSTPRTSGPNPSAQDASEGGGSSSRRPPGRVGLPTDSTEMAPLIGMDVNTNPLVAVSENVRTGLYAPDAYGNESDHHELRAKARDLGLSDYLDEGFTSTW
ncbi:hypothetical protein BDV93DRAFT_540154 [Ceratobasidium sp. AG-I]|nr:hypothetical protein BDV93DRAFT_540154 [Ceratobasidium sp. AG-I]